MKFRRLDGSEPKYDQESGQQLGLFNVAATLEDSKVICITEGELDAVAIEMHLQVPCVAYPGASTWQKNSEVWGRVFDGYEQVIVVGDGDDAGKQAAKQVSSMIPGDIARAVVLPDGLDANSFINEFGADDLRALLGLEN